MRRPATAPSRDCGIRAGAGSVPESRTAVLRLKRERIIAVARDLFHEHGINNTRLDAVADKLDVTKPVIYSHFSSKSQLLAEICWQGIRASLDVLNRVIATDESATDKVQALVRNFMLAVLQNQKNIAIYTREQKHLAPGDAEAVNRLRREFDGKLHALLQGGVETGEFVVGDAQLASLCIGGMVSWSSVWYRPGGRLTPAEAADRISDLVLAMVQARPVRRRKPRGVACAVG